MLDPRVDLVDAQVDELGRELGDQLAEAQSFLERIRPLMEAELTSGDSSRWPVITLNLDFKTECGLSGIDRGSVRDSPHSMIHDKTCAGTSIPPPVKAAP